jgi:hypothetical protein
MNNYNLADDKGHFEQYVSVSFTDVIKQINLYAVDASQHQLELSQILQDHSFVCLLNLKNNSLTEIA